jgi:hypothetical protein
VDPPELDHRDVVVEHVGGDLLRALRRLALDLVVGREMVARAGHERPVRVSVFPFSPAAIEAVEDRLEGFDLAKGTVRFTPDRPVPDDVVEDLVRVRRREIAG